MTKKSAKPTTHDTFSPSVATVKVWGKSSLGRIHEGQAVVRRDEVGDQAAVLDEVAKACVVVGPIGRAHGLVARAGSGHVMHLADRPEEALLDLLGEAVVRDVQARHAPGISDYVHHPHKDTAM